MKCILMYFLFSSQRIPYTDKTRGAEMALGRVLSRIWKVSAKNDLKIENWATYTLLDLRGAKYGSS